MNHPLPPPAGTVVFVGVATLDAIALVGALPGADERVVARDIAFSGGGPAATAAVAAARLGVATAFVGAVGDDEDGRRILAGLEQEGVDTSGVAVVAGRASGASVVVVDAGQGTRIICTRPVPPLDPSLLPSGAQEMIRHAQWVHVDHLGWETVHRLIADRATRPRLSVDAGNPIPGFSPAGVDLYVPTVEALRRIHGPLDDDALLQAALAAGADVVVATRGGDGAIAATRQGSRCSAPAHRADIVSTLGAGDVFHGALLSAVVQGRSLQESLHLANVVAAESCAGVDGRSAIPVAARVEDLLAALV